MYNANNWTEDAYRERCKKAILDFATEKVSAFLDQHPHESFYAFAFDCNSVYGEVNLCFNTEMEFQNTLRYYQGGKSSANYQSEEQIKEIKYNTGDWKYQSFDTFYCEDEDELARRYGDDTDKQTSEMMGIFWAALHVFTQTELFCHIQKTEDFIAFCIDHDEEVEEALAKAYSL